MKNRILCLITSLLVVCKLFAFDFAVNGIMYNIIGTNTVEVTRLNGSDYSGNITIPSTVTNSGTTYNVTQIGYEAFVHCYNLTHISMPSSITTIGGRAFVSCPFTSITIPVNVTSIGSDVFKECSLTSIICEPVFAPNCMSDAFDDMYSNPNVYVPAGNGTCNSYHNSSVWSNLNILCSYRLTVSSNDNTQGTVSGDSIYAEDSYAVIYGCPNRGYKFKQWNDGNRNNPRILQVTTDSSFVAHFIPDTFQVNALSNNANMGSVTGAGMYPYRDIATVTAIPSNGYKFQQWSNGDTASTIYVDVQTDTVLIAFFAVDQHTVTVLSNDTSMGNVIGGGLFNNGDSVILNATANNHYHFVNWSNGQTSPTIAIIVSSDTTLIATFEADVYNVTVTANYASRGTVTGGGQYSYLH